jgi:hypothetical protein
MFRDEIKKKINQENNFKKIRIKRNGTKLDIKIQ